MIMEALICMLGDGSAPLFPDLAFEHLLIATQRGFTLFFHSLGSLSFICLFILFFPLLLPHASSCFP